MTSELHSDGCVELVGPVQQRVQSMSCGALEGFYCEVKMKTYLKFCSPHWNQSGPGVGSVVQIKNSSDGSFLRGSWELTVNFITVTLLQTLPTVEHYLEYIFQTNFDVMTFHYCFYCFLLHLISF